MRPEGALAAMATPFQIDGSLNPSTLRKMVDFMIERGVDGIFAASTVGEFVHLTTAQRHELVALTVEYADGRVPVLAGAAEISPSRVIDHCREFKRAGASYATVAPPFYYPMRQDDLLAHYRRVADSIDLPLVVYNIPQFSNPLGVETMLKIIETCEPVALKNSNTSIIEMMTVLHAIKDKPVSYLVGPDELILTGLEQGAAGCMSGVTGVLPEAVRTLTDAFRAGQVDFARKIQFAVLELLELISDLPFPYSFKLLLTARGFDMGPPVHAQSAATLERIDRRKPAITRRIEDILKLASSY